MELKMILYVMYASITIKFVCGSQVPVFMWGVNSDTLDVKPTSALELLTAENFGSYIKKVLDVPKTTLIAFVQDKLSLEDLTVYGANEDQNVPFHNLQDYLDHQSSSIFPSVEDPASILEKMRGQYKVTDINLESPHTTESLRAILDNSDVIIAHLPYAEIIAERKSVLQNNDHLIGKFLKTVSGSKKNFVVLYTGMTSSWEQVQSSDEPHIRVARHILAEKDNSTNCTAPIVDKNCSLVYLEKLTIMMNLSGNKTVNSTVPCPNSYVSDSSCDLNDTVIVNMTFQNIIDETPLSLVFVFKNLSSTWYLEELNLFFTDSEDEAIPLAPKSVGAANGFSYSCGNLVIPTPSYLVNTSGYIVLENFQIQPFVSMNESMKFASSFDCVPFFTIPIWMGLFITLTFTFILAVGIYALFDVKTMDRFDDPKGKTISVPTTE